MPFSLIKTSRKTFRKGIITRLWCRETTALPYQMCSTHRDRTTISMARPLPYSLRLNLYRLHLLKGYPWKTKELEVK